MKLYSVDMLCLHGCPPAFIVVRLTVARTKVIVLYCVSHAWFGFRVCLGRACSKRLTSTCARCSRDMREVPRSANSRPKKIGLIAAGFAVFSPQSARIDSCGLSVLSVRLYGFVRMEASRVYTGRWERTGQVMGIRAPRTPWTRSRHGHGHR